MYEGDRKILELLGKKGVFEARARYKGKMLEHFEFTRVA